MNDLETQLRHYATAVAGPARHDDTELFEIETELRRPQRRLFAVAAGVLVALAVAIGLVAATRSHQSSTMSATSEANGLRVRLDVNTTAPSPTGEVKVKMTVTNVSDEPITTLTLCPNSVTIERPDASSVQAGGTSAALTPPEALVSWFDPMRQGVIFHAVGDSGTPSDPTCRRQETTLKPGAGQYVTAAATPGPLGLDQVPMNIVARAWPPVTVPPATLPFTVPEPPAGQVSRSAAIATATARPEAQQWANQVQFGEAAPAAAASRTDSAADSTASSFEVVPDGDGWQINVTYGTHSLDVHINADGTTGSTTADGTTTTF